MVDDSKRSLDIIANKFLRPPAINSKVVEGTGNLHDEIVVFLFRIAEKVFDNSTSFNPSNDMLDDNPDAGDETVLLFLFWGKLFPFGFLLRLKRLHTLWFIPLKASIFIHPDVRGVCGAFFISNLFIMAFAFIGLTQRSYWIPGSWHVRMMYTDGIPFHDPSQESDRAGQHQESHRRGAVLSDGS